MGAVVGDAAEHSQAILGGVRDEWRRLLDPLAQRTHVQMVRRVRLVRLPSDHLTRPLLVAPALALRLLLLCERNR